jgi:type IV pilus assembly protein PilA
MTNDQSVQGFTLIELMIVICIVGILATIAVSQFIAQKTRACNTMAISDIKNTSIAQEAYYVDHRKYTSDLDMLRNYGFRQTQGVTVGVPSSGESAYRITAYHDKGDQTYTLVGPQGTITSD